jgi:hypothetical protein
MLLRDAKQRADAEQLLQDEWIMKNVEQKEISEDVLLDISHNLQ